MFPKFHPHHHHHNPFSITPQVGGGDGDGDGVSPILSQKQPKQSAEPNSRDGASIEVSRRPRGRPPGSKNKPKSPIILTAHEPEPPPLRPYVIEVCAGNDVVKSVAHFCRRKNFALCVLTGSGTVANVSLRQPSATPRATVTFHGRFEILSLNATFFPQTPSYPTVLPNSFTISLAGPQGQIVGGLVTGSLIAAGTVYLIAASFNNPSYHRLPPDEEVQKSESGCYSGGGGAEGQSLPATGAEEGQGSELYGCHAPSDVIWAPTARQPPPPPPPPPHHY